MIAHLARSISVLFHPLILNLVLICLVYLLNPYAFDIEDDRGAGVFLIMTGVIVFVFPVIAVAMMLGLKMIPSLEMTDKKDRIGPLIVVMTCYIWFFLNVYNSPVYPPELAAIALGSCVAVVLGFFINNFSKISLHAIGAGGFLVGLFLLQSEFARDPFKIQVPFAGAFWVSSIFALLLAVLLCGLIGSARLYLGAHRQQDVYGGYLVGALAFILAFRILI